MAEELARRFNEDAKALEDLWIEYTHNNVYSQTPEQNRIFNELGRELGDMRFKTVKAAWTERKIVRLYRRLGSFETVGTC